MKKRYFLSLLLFIMFSFLIIYNPQKTLKNEETNISNETTISNDEDNNTSVKIELQDSELVMAPPILDVSSELETESKPNIIDSTSGKKVHKGSCMPKYYCVWGEFSLTEEEYKLLLTTTFCESGNQSLETQHMTALVILNRLADGNFGANLHEVIYAKSAFAVTNWSNFENRGWTPQVEEAVELALKENPHPRDMFYFRTGHFHSWAKDYMKSGDVYFSTKN